MSIKQVQHHVDHISQILEKAKQEIAAMSMDDDLSGVPKPVTPCKASFNWSLSAFEKCTGVVDGKPNMSYSYHYTVSPVDKQEMHMNACIDWIEKTVEETHANNLDAISYNKKKIEQIYNLMNAFSIPKSFSKTYYKTARSKTMTTESRDAGFISDVNSIYVTSDGYEFALHNIADMRKLVKTHCEKIREKERIELEQKKKEQQKIDARNFVIKLAIKYQFTTDNIDDLPSELLNFMMSKHCLIELAYAMESARNDFDNIYMVENYLTSEVNDKYPAIYESISDIDPDGDGRAFRDCKYNYDYLLNLVCEESPEFAELISDINELKEKQYQEFG